MSTDKIHKYNFDDIIERILKAKGWKTEKDVANALGMKPVAFSGRKSRNSPPVDKIRIWCNRESINIDWVLLGEGPMFTGGERLSFSEKAVQNPPDTEGETRFSVQQALEDLQWSPESRGGIVQPAEAARVRTPHEQYGITQRKRRLINDMVEDLIAGKTEAEADELLKPVLKDLMTLLQDKYNK